MRVHAAHALYIHCSCHRLQLAFMQAAESIAPVKKMFGTMGNLWKLFYYSLKKAEALKEVQSVLKLPELKIVKPSHTRWLSHERCVRAIRKELPALIVTLQQLYHRVGRLSRDEPDSPLTQYITNAGISRARYTITHFKHHHRVLRLISNRISV